MKKKINKRGSDNTNFSRLRRPKDKPIDVLIIVLMTSSISDLWTNHSGGDESLNKQIICKHLLKLRSLTSVPLTRLFSSKVRTV